MAEGAYLGIDVGTSGVRAIAIDRSAQVLATAARPMAAPATLPDGGRRQAAAIWAEAVDAVIAEIAAQVADPIAAVAVDGTSGTLLLVDADGRPLGPARMYNDAGSAHRAADILAVAPPESGAHGATSPLARLLDMQTGAPPETRALHQADWIAGRLIGRFEASDDNNALKLGWDPVRRCWPDWFKELGVRRQLLPQVVNPGDRLGTVISGPLAGAVAVAGTTDGCASFLATGAASFGDGVTALGSTLTLKLLSDTPIFAPHYGVYSHRLGRRWLVGGASNTGGAALLRYFSPEQIQSLSVKVKPETPTGRHWHPLPAVGERFPKADPAMRFDPSDRPEDAAQFLQALLEGIAEVEGEAYRILQSLGAPALRSVRTVGGGAGNRAWSAIRARILEVPMVPPMHQQAAYGTALLAREGGL